ncbi:MAG: penicillin-binding transpeptidase domain-containing protein [Candidatus Paceibacterota bacterium]
MWWRRRRSTNQEVDPDEIFLDASNNPLFDRARFEGRIEQPLAPTTFLSVTVVLVAIVSTLAIRAGYLQVVQGAAFAAQSAQNSLEPTALFAPRGIITDRNGVVLVENVDAKKGTGTGRKYLMPEMGQIIGYVSYPKKDKSGNYYDTNITGVAGLEAMYNEQLSGENGRILVEKDARGEVRSSGMIVPAKEGRTLVLSVDATLERSLAKAISTIADKTGFIAGAGVIMDVHTGEVHAIVSYPSYDPNVMSNGAPASTIAGYNTSQGHPFLDHAVQGVYAPGSVVKPIVAAGALTDGLITPQTLINDPGRLVVPDPYKPGKNYYYNGWKPLGIVDVEKAIAWSSDIFFYTVGGGFGDRKGLGIERLDYWYYQFGLGSPTGIDLPSEARGVVPSPEWKRATFKEAWYLGDTYFTSIGQYGTQVTPMQMARATAAIANGGTLLTPTIRAGIPPVSTSVPVSTDALVTVRAGMRQTVTSALAQALNVPYLTVAAKTGTAQTGTRNQYDNSWVVGFFPYEEPQYAFAVVLERGPEGAGSQAVNVMRTLFDLLKSEDSVYVGGRGTSASAPTE